MIYRARIGYRIVDDFILTNTDKIVLMNAMARQLLIDSMFPAEFPYGEIRDDVLGDGHCRICLDEIDPNTTDYYLHHACRNAVHRRCQNDWLWHSNNCNTCRNPILLPADPF